ncbi:MAG: hypothetical protein ACPGYK_05410 [Flavobacteriales bacterium]
MKLQVKQMLTHYIQVLFLVLLAAGSWSVAQGQSLSDASDINLMQFWSQEPNGWSYPIAISIPEGDPPFGGFPVGVILHGSNGNGPAMLDLGESLLWNHILIAPTGYLNSWNLCGESSEAPDIAMLAELIAQLLTFDNVNPEHIRLIGFSNGAGLVNQGFIELDSTAIDVFVAIVSQMNEPQFHQGAFHRPSGLTIPPMAFCGYDEVVLPPMGRKYLSICNHNDSVVPYDGGPAVGNVFLPAEVSIHQVALQQGHVGPPVPGEDLNAPGLTVFSYLDGDVVLLRGGAEHGTNPAQLEFAAEFLAIDESPDPPTSGCIEDLDNDSLVAVADVLLLLGEFGCSTFCNYDVNGDEWVNVSDLLQMISAFGTICN